MSQPDRLPRDDPSWGWEFAVEDFVLERILEQEQAAAALPDGPDREAATTRTLALRQILLEHSIYVGSDGWNWARCFSCESGHGTPCETVINLARLWPDHPDLPRAARGRPFTLGSSPAWAGHGTWRRHYERGRDTAAGGST